jgi:hypothetical protein
VTQAWPKGHPSVTQARPKRRMAKVFCLQQKLEKGRGGGTKSARSPESRVLEKQNLTAETLRTAKIESLIQSTNPGIESRKFFGMLIEDRGVGVESP